MGPHYSWDSLFLNSGFGELDPQQLLPLPPTPANLASSSFPPAASPWPPRAQSGAQHWGRMTVPVPHCVPGGVRLTLGQGGTIQLAEHPRNSPRPPLDLGRRQRSKEAKKRQIRNSEKASQRTSP